jgi:hypothetical protein
MFFPFELVWSFFFPGITGFFAQTTLYFGSVYILFPFSKQKICHLLCLTHIVLEKKFAPEPACRTEHPLPLPA